MFNFKTVYVISFTIIMLSNEIRSPKAKQSVKFRGFRYLDILNTTCQVLVRFRNMTRLKRQLSNTIKVNRMSSSYLKNTCDLNYAA